MVATTTEQVSLNNKANIKANFLIVDGAGRNDRQCVFQTLRSPISPLTLDLLAPSRSPTRAAFRNRPPRPLNLTKLYQARGGRSPGSRQRQDD